MCLMCLIKPVLIQHPVRLFWRKSLIDLGLSMFILICSLGFSNVFACRSFHHVFIMFSVLFQDFSRIFPRSYLALHDSELERRRVWLATMVCGSCYALCQGTQGDATQMQRRCNIACNIPCTKTTYNIYIIYLQCQCWSTHVVHCHVVSTCQRDADLSKKWQLIGRVAKHFFDIALEYST